jgi:thioredoxin 1
MTEALDTTFEETVLKSKKPVLLYFWAATCKPCKIMKPEIDEIMKELGDRLEFVHTDAVANDEICQKCGVMSTPTIILFHQGEPALRIVGYVTKEDLRSRIENQLKLLA